MLCHNSFSEEYRCPSGALSCGMWERIRFRCNESNHVELRLWDGSEHFYTMVQIEPGLFETIFRVPETAGLVWYDFLIHLPNGTDLWYGNQQDGLGGEGKCTATRERSYQITVYSPEYAAPSFLREAVIYQIFPDRFKVGKSGFGERSSQIKQAHPDALFHTSWDEAPLLDISPEDRDARALDFFGGTLEGIAEELDSLAEMGVTVIYLNPIFRASTNHRYDTGSYEEIDPILGDNEDFSRLCSQAAQRGIRILLDGVFSHSGRDSMYFNRYGRYPTLGAAQSTESKFYPWYRFHSWPEKYKTWWGFQNLPELNKNDPAYRNYLLAEKQGILPRWIKAGASGWRLDVADELPMDLIAAMRRAVKEEDPSAALIGEVWEDASAKVSYGELRSYCLGDTLDGVMNYPLRRGIIDFFTGICDAYALGRIILHQREVYPAPFLYSQMNLLGSHDRLRILNAMAGYDTPAAGNKDRHTLGKLRLTEAELAASKEKFLRAVALLCALPGAPTLYYGDEVGMQGMGDPWNRAPMERTHPDEALRSSVSALLRERKGSPMLQRGFMDVAVADEDTLIIRRYGKQGRDPFGEDLPGEERIIRISRR